MHSLISFLRCYTQIYDLSQYKNDISEHSKGKCKGVLLLLRQHKTYSPPPPSTSYWMLLCWLLLLFRERGKERVSSDRTLGLSQWKLHWKHVGVQSETMESKQNQYKTTGIKAKWGPQLTEPKGLSKMRIPHSPFHDCLYSGRIYRLLLISAPLLCRTL